MSTLEKKALAFEKLAALNKDEAIDEILILLEKLNEENSGRVHNLSKHYDAISNRYDETLKKLAE